MSANEFGRYFIHPGLMLHYVGLWLVVMERDTTSDDRISKHWRCCIHNPGSPRPTYVRTVDQNTLMDLMLRDPPADTEPPAELRLLALVLKDEKG